MSRNSEMFKFTQLRPVNGIDYYEVQSKHFPLYDESKPTSLLKKIQKMVCLWVSIMHWNILIVPASRINFMLLKISQYRRVLKV